MSICFAKGSILPEVSMVAILDADKEGFLRSETSLIQTIGRAARNANSKVILYADRMTASMQTAIEETQRRRKLQEAYNLEHGITPETVRKGVTASILQAAENRKRARDMVRIDATSERITEDYLKTMEEEMLAAAENLEFERAAALAGTKSCECEKRSENPSNRIRPMSEWLAAASASDPARAQVRESHDLNRSRY